MHASYSVVYNFHRSKPNLPESSLVSLSLFQPVGGVTLRPKEARRAAHQMVQPPAPAVCRDRGAPLGPKSARSAGGAFCLPHLGSESAHAFFGFLVVWFLFIFTGGLQKAKFFATIPRVEMASGGWCPCF